MIFEKVVIALRILKFTIILLVAISFTSCSLESGEVDYDALLDIAKEISKSDSKDTSYKYTGDWVFKSGTTSNIARINDSIRFEYGLYTKGYDLEGIIYGYSSGNKNPLEGRIYDDGEVEFKAYFNNGNTAYYRGKMISGIINGSVVYSSGTKKTFRAEKAEIAALFTENYKIDEDSYEYASIFVPSGWTPAIGCDISKIPGYGIEVFLMDEGQFYDFKKYGLLDYEKWAWISLSNDNIVFDIFRTGKYYLVFDNSNRGEIKVDKDIWNDYARLNITFFLAQR